MLTRTSGTQDDHALAELLLLLISLSSPMVLKPSPERNYGQIG